MKRLLALILGITVLQATFTWAENTVQKEPLHVTKTKRDVAINSHIKGDQHVDYRIEAKSGQALTVEFTPNHQQRTSMCSLQPPKQHSLPAQLPGITLQAS